MKETSLSTRRQLELMRQMQRAATEREREERRIASQREVALREAKGRRDERRAAAEEAADVERDAIDTDCDGRRSMNLAAYEAERQRTQDEYRDRRHGSAAEAAKAVEQAEQHRKDATWQLQTEFENAQKRAEEKLQEALGRLVAVRGEVATIGAEAMSIARDRGVSEAEYDLGGAPAGKPATGDVDDDACREGVAHLGEAIDRARDATQSLYDQLLPRMLEGPIPAGVFIGTASVALPMAGMTLGWQDWRAYAIGIGGAALAAVAAYLALAPGARKQTRGGFDAAKQSLLEAEQALAESQSLAARRAECEIDTARRMHDGELAALQRITEQAIETAHSRRDAELEEISQRYPAMLTQMRTRHEQELEKIEQEQGDRATGSTRAHDSEVAAIEAEYEASVELAESAAERAWQRLFEQWFVAYDDVRAELRDMRSECQRLFPDFGETDYDAWEPPADPPGAVAFGRTEIDLARIKDGLSNDPRLTPPETRLEMPALMTLEEHPTMLLTASGEAKPHADALLRAMMLRFLTAMPPGKVRFTILDPVGLGENFQSFMHLADSDEQLIAGRIWSEPRDIEEQLARLTNHMETVLQKHLRSEFETIHEYNAQAGEVAEPFQVLVVAGFPSNFTEVAARRLVSLVTGGPRCGVYTLIGVDERARLPSEFQMDDLKQNAAWLDWQGDPGSGRFVWRYPAFDKLPLDLIQEPPADRFIDTVRKAGEAAKRAVRVEVPFSIVEPTEGLWRDRCGSELLVPIGRAGAKRLQEVRLGKGTSQHLLVAGKTGSGKSTFLHALVTSAAMRLSPDEVEFYLVDFKKGVEFKSYATHRLPHARVIAIESEREFGLSVLARLDDELKHRGERFREAGVQNLADYRAARPDEKTPRVLLIVDEFQELFVEDDKLAQEAALLLDRLVRQGRAFGVHVLLGTQTLAGAYSIARSTLGQIAVRVALECSEADSHLILSDERNNAARFLSRPGEAIYNAQNGLVSANEPFQVVWLSDRERAAKLDAIDEHRHAHELQRAETIVFEGNAPADPLENTRLASLITGESIQPPAGAPAAWLGAAVAIKPPTSVAFGRHPGANLLVVGPQEGAALGVLTTAIASLRLTDPTARVVVLDGSRPGERSDGVWRRVLDAVAPGAQLVEARGLAEAATSLAAEVAAREATDEQPPPIYVIVHNASRFRDLRRGDDDFGFGGFGSSDEPPAKPDKQLAEVLKNGPAVGVHTLVWCDSYNSVTRLYDRQTLREFAFRVALQMSAADSSNLIDTPAAGDLKPHRALLYNDETGQTEKFRPYGEPSDEWIDRLAEAGRVPAQD